MSEERRKRRQERIGEARSTPVPMSRSERIWIAIGVVIVLAYGAYWYYVNHRYDGFAKCLAAKQVKMYGLFDCPHCADQKAMFGAAFHYVPYVECRNRTTRAVEPVCEAAGVKLYPSWEFAGNPPSPGVYPLQELSDKTGCSLP